ncbi:SNF2 family DNA-dependent ATPase [Mycena crocata]|nr:SNF2 family DNA-dependent ATPase [Mycena crocata]
MLITHTPTQVLERSALYSKILKQQMDAARERHVERRAAEREKLRAAKERKERAEAKKKAAAEARAGRRPVKRRRRNEPEQEEDDTAAFPQPALITGARLKDYQLEGLQWMVSLHEQGISGILADEMGLGKTLQTIAFSAHLRELEMSRPFLVVCPLSVLHNWKAEYERFAPGIPVLLYHGTPAERAEMRRTIIPLPAGYPPAASKSSASPSKSKSKKGRPAKNVKNATSTSTATSTKKGKGKAKPALAPPPTPVSRGRGHAAEPEDEVEEEGEEEDGEQDDQDNNEPNKTRAEKALEKAHDDHFRAFPVVITTYDLIIRDRPVLGAYPWGYIVVDEGHRLKNLNCALMREVKRYNSAGRMVLTGTPLHNNLAELWSLLNFILPDIFNDVDAFQEWFSLPRMSSLLPSARMATFIGTLHTILKPFLLRRMKVDVLGTCSALPPKKSYVLYAPLSAHQREAYEAVLGGDVRGWVAKTAGMGAVASSSSNAASSSSSTPALTTSASSPSTPATPVTPAEDGDVPMEGVVDTADAKPTAADGAEGRMRTRQRKAKGKGPKHVNNMKLQNTVMQLRKVCSHPFLFARPDDDKWALGTFTLLPFFMIALLGASGKMLLLDRLLGELFHRRHKVLLFSQFTTMLDIIEDWAVDMKGWRICRIDGTTPPLERRDQMDVFQAAGDAPDAPRLFLLSTRSGGLGVNLTAADTVIFYDQDWNPQMDAQAQDRAHRIGQTKPVLIFRLVSAHTIEEKIMQRAGEKRKLEALVIAKGKFKMPAAEEAAAPTTAKRGRARTTMAEMAADLLRLEGEQIDVLPSGTTGDNANLLSDADLDALLDRSPEVFTDRGTGWRSSAARAAFAVFEPAVEEGSDALAAMMGEEGGEDAEG